MAASCGTQSLHTGFRAQSLSRLLISVSETLGQMSEPQRFQNPTKLLLPVQALRHPNLEESLCLSHSMEIKHRGGSKIGGIFLDLELMLLSSWTLQCVRAQGVCEL